MKLRVGGNVRLVVAEQIQLNLVIAGPVQEMLVQREAFRRNTRSVRLALQVLKLRRTGLEKSAKIVSVFIGWILPVGLDGIPAITQPFLVGIAILGDQPGQTLRAGDSQTKTDRRAVVKNVERIAGQVQRVCKALDDFCQVVEGVAKRFCWRSVGEANRGESE